MPTTPLTQQNFRTVVATDHIVLVEFWATWCVWCTRFAPVFEESARRHREPGPQAYGWPGLRSA
ncbi:MAG: hypothetical protein HOQ44_14700 [Nocardia sp.]|nr:hypothetical protein [Nocardia sp.]